MKLSCPRFSIPACLLEEDLPDKAKLLLIFLFSQSSIEGRCSPGYQAIKDGVGITSRSTISSALKLLRSKGWFLYVKKGNGRNSVFQLQIPKRLLANPHVEALATRMYPVQ